MRLAEIEIRDYRSIFVDDAGQPLRFQLGSGMNTLVGLNNGGKSNVLRAVSLALDPHHHFDRQQDAPGPRPFSLPIITLRFVAEGGRPEERDVLAAAGVYEEGLGGSGDTHASRGEIVLQVAFQPEGDGVRRRELLLTFDERRPANADDDVRLEAALKRLRESVRFVLISSGESIESVLEGNFREILHSVVRERLADDFSNAERSRNEYIEGLQDSLLAPLRERLSRDVGVLFPEIAATHLTPEVPDIERTLSNVGVSLDDIISTPLSQKGTGIRGGVLVAMLSYLSLNATRSMVFALEEPEAFLHPAAQEDLRDHLERLASSPDVSLLVTTHSPFIVTKAAEGRIFLVAKDTEGRTRIAQQASGDASHAPLVGDLFREASLSELLAKSSSLPDGTKGVLLVEGDGDVLSLELAAKVVDRPDLLEGIHIRASGGTKKIVVEAIIARAAASVPVFVLLDNDRDGRDAMGLLCSEKFNFQKTKHVTTYAEVFSKDHAGFPYEAEDVFAPELIQAFVDEHGQSVTDGSKKRPDDAFHYDFSQSAKAELEAFLALNARPTHVLGWIQLILLIRARLDMPGIAETADEIVAAAEASAAPVEKERIQGAVLVVANKLDYARYTSMGALIIDVDQQVAPGVTHVAFYVDGAIKATIPKVEADYPGLLFSNSTAEQLRATGRAHDARVADLIEESLRVEDVLGHVTHRLLLLSRPDDLLTMTLEHPIKNTKQRNGKPLAWTVGPKVVPLAAIAEQPRTTEELEKLETELL
jgi:hypothetical protein